MTSNSTPAKVAVVTGASSGIGAATARALEIRSSAVAMATSPFPAPHRASALLRHRARGELGG